jgi:hypothetical protein
MNSLIRQQNALMDVLRELMMIDITINIIWGKFMIMMKTAMDMVTILIV